MGEEDETAKREGCKSRIDHRIDASVAGVPIDYSFRKVENLSELSYGLPREYRIGKPRKGPSDRYVTRSLWANYNNLEDLTSVSSLVACSLEQPELISWLDVSFNQIHTISKEILSLRNLAILYLHGNKIQFLYEVEKLRDLKRLKTLTLHGNPVEEVPNYRMHILRLLPQLKNLDFSVVADFERNLLRYTRIV